MDDIPQPQVLDPGRVSRDDREDMTAEDHRNRAQLLARALDESCEYGRQLWGDLAAARQYLHESLPGEPATQPPGGASPTGPDDDAGWQRWIDAFASITSVLCGPHGDSGYGRETATALARSHRQVVVPVLAPHADPELTSALTWSGTPETVLREANSPHADSDPTTDETTPQTHRSTVTAGSGSGSGTTASRNDLWSPLAYGALGSIVTLMALGKRRPLVVLKRFDPL